MVPDTNVLGIPLFENSAPKDNNFGASILSTNVLAANLLTADVLGGSRFLAQVDTSGATGASTDSGLTLASGKTLVSPLLAFDDLYLFGNGSTEPGDLVLNGGIYYQPSPWLAAPPVALQIHAPVQITGNLQVGEMQIVGNLNIGTPGTTSKATMYGELSVIGTTSLEVLEVDSLKIGGVTLEQYIQNIIDSQP